jgi:adenylate cyclase
MLAVLAGVAVVGGGIYGSTYSASSVGALLRGPITGLLTALPMASYELCYVLSPRGEALRRLSVGTAMAIKTVVYLVIILFGLEAGRQIAAIGADLPPRADYEVLRNTLFSLGFAIVVTAVLQVRRMLGPGVLMNFILGRYHKPREELRIFLFVDLVGSTELAERIAGTRFLEMLNSIYRHITEPIAEHGGEIHKYVGDEVIVTWRPKTGFADANCLRCVFAIEAQMRGLADFYERKFGHVPKFRGGLHLGPVVVGEVGDIKQEIAFLGDGMNTTARLVDLCREKQRAFVASAAVLERLTLPAGIVAEPLGDITLRGKSEPLPVFALTRRPATA